jgi:class 3 adenylate cyclase
VAEARFRSLDQPDEVRTFPRLRISSIDLGDHTVGRIENEPGWRWSVDVQPSVGGQWCQARHVGVILSGRLGVEMSDGQVMEIGPGDVFEIPPGHDGYTIGDEPCVQIEWTGVRAFTGYQLMGNAGRTLATLLFTDLVGSTALARQSGDAVWRDRLSAHFEMIRGELETHHGREVNTTGDGLLATFDGPAGALLCAAAIRRRSAEAGLQIRASVHVGEVELVGADVRGVAVHEAARILGVAKAGEILVSATTRALAEASGFTFVSCGTHELKGLPGPRELFAYEA